ncbi:MAG: hypothetical protein HOK52_11165 [Candidatus Marinimicrobia bacterium]|jgi:structure-specific recognition protein 1|nr:hypothetical protein [Candidatus Neomarinimicrobiota bacterium]
MVALELGQPDKVPELLEKFLGNKMKIKAQKNPNAPKRAKSSYMFYSEKYRENVTLKLKKKNPNYKGSLMGLVSKDLGANWKKLKDNEKKVFETQAAKDKQRYLHEMEEFNEKYA